MTPKPSGEQNADDSLEQPFDGAIVPTITSDNTGPAATREQQSGSLGESGFRQPQSNQAKAGSIPAGSAPSAPPKPALTDVAFAECVRQGGKHEPFHGPLIDLCRELEAKAASLEQQLEEVVASGHEWKRQAVELAAQVESLRRDGERLIESIEHVEVVLRETPAYNGIRIYEMFPGLKKTLDAALGKGGNRKGGS